MPVACQSCAPECPQAFGAEGDLPRIIPRGMPGARSLRARLPWQSRGFSRSPMGCACPNMKTRRLHCWRRVLYALNYAIPAVIIAIL